MYYIAIAAAISISLLCAWFFSDKVIFSGPATIIPNNNMKHVSKTHRTVFVSVPSLCDLLVGTVPIDHPATKEIGFRPMSRVTIKQRLFENPRVAVIA